MKKTLIFCTILFLFGCSQSENLPPKIFYTIHGITQINENREVAFSLSRSDTNLTQPKGYVSTTDLPAEIRTIALMLDDFVCDIDSIPHKCEIDSGKDKYSLSVAFADNAKFTTDFYVPKITDIFPAPEISAPKEDTGDKSIFEFTLVDADDYIVSLEACYELDCIKNEYLVFLENNEWLIKENSDLNFFAELKSFAQILRVDFEFDPKLFDSVKYTVSANKKGRKIQNIETNYSSTSEVSFTF
ncbi:MAG: hypothetical protein R6V74_01925 [Lutibacter sp.]